MHLVNNNASLFHYQKHFIFIVTLKGSNHLLNTTLPHCFDYCPLVCFVSDSDKQWLLATPFFFGLISMKKSLSRMNFEILILHFENKNCFNVILKQFVFEILQLPGFFFLEKWWFVLVSMILKLIKVHYKVTFCFFGFQSKRLEKLEVLFEKFLFLFFNTHLSTWIIMSSLFTMS
jgi:hypothetical protein